MRIVFLTAAVLLGGCGGPELFATWKFSTTVRTQSPSGALSDGTPYEYEIRISQGATSDGAILHFGACQLAGRYGPSTQLTMDVHDTCTLSAGDRVPLLELSDGAAQAGDKLEVTSGSYLVNAKDELEQQLDLSVVAGAHTGDTLSVSGKGARE